MQKKRTRIAAVAGLALAAVLMAAPAAHAYDDRYDGHRHSNYNDEYIFATTRMVSEWEVSPAVKVPFFPPAVVIDIVFLPAEVIAGFF